MGVYCSSPYVQRKYQDGYFVHSNPLDGDDDVYYEGEEDGRAEEGKGTNAIDKVEDLPSQSFGNVYGSTFNVLPDDLSALSDPYLVVNMNECLYVAEIDQGHAFRCLRPWLPLALACYPVTAAIAASGLVPLLGCTTCDEMCCWVKKEFSQRVYIKVYPNRVEINYPTMRIPWGLFGCGSWTTDAVRTHPFDRGAFGFRLVHCTYAHLLCFLPVYGGVVARQRCQCNGSPKRHGCNGWWCTEWPCGAMCCSFRYNGLAHPEEFAAAAGLALQAFFEGRALHPNDMERCLEFWRKHVWEKREDTRQVCCEGFALGNPLNGSLCYQFWTHPFRSIPFKKEQQTPHLVRVYAEYAKLREDQIKYYKQVTAKERTRTICRCMGCERVCGQNGVFFCAEDIACCHKKDHSSEEKRSSPPMDINAPYILHQVLGPAPEWTKYGELLKADDYIEEPLALETATQDGPDG